MMDPRRATGKRGEDEACGLLVSLGHSILERNWRHGHKEVDIISLAGNELHIVEVKSKTAPVVADPVLSVGKAKQDYLAKAAAAYLHSKQRIQLPHNLEVVFDVVSVVFTGGQAQVEYYPQAFIPTYA